MNVNKNITRFTQEDFALFVQIWNRASISLLDVRHNLISPMESIYNYQLPAGSFLYTCGGGVKVILDNVPYHTERFGVFHGGKGAKLSILPQESLIEYYIVLYKAGEPGFRKKEYARLLEQSNPFSHQYGFVPQNPILLSELLCKMYEKWKDPTSLNQFYGKAAFYQIIYEIYEGLDKGHIPVLQPDIAAIARSYIDDRYMQNINIQNMADSLNISYSHLHRIFTRQFNQSPQEYLMKVRLHSCKERLQDTRYSMREIAFSAGFSDERHFHRMFTKHIGMSPGEYREKMLMNRRDSALGNILPFSYNKDKTVSYNKPREKGEYSMFKQMKNKALFTAALSLMLLLTACSKSPADTAKSMSKSTVSSQAAELKSGEAKNETRAVNTVMGEVNVPTNPQRVAVWVYEQELYSLGVTPVSVSPGNYESMWPDIPVFSYAPDKEELMSLNPDLIITYDNEEFYREYSDIAPIVCIPLDTDSEEALRLIGNILNETDKAEELIQNFNEQSDKAKVVIEKKGILGKTAVLVEPSSDSIWIYDNAYGRGGSVLYDNLGFTIPENVKSALGSEHFAKVSLETLPEYCNADYIVVIAGDGYNELKNNEIWKSLPAVINNKVLEYDASKYNGRGLDTDTLSLFSEYFSEN
jgi:iron complex transport system substrate-binding protein